MTSPAAPAREPITLDEAARLAEHALATAQRHPGAAVVLTPYVVRCLLDAAQASAECLDEGAVVVAAGAGEPTHG